MASSTNRSTPPKPGVYCPAVTFFDQTTDALDLPSQSRYYTYLSRTGLTGLVILGTNAEAFLLTREERYQLIACARAAVGPTYPLIAGVGAHSTKQVLELVADAEKAGANYVLILPPAYFGKATSMEVVKGFFKEVAEKSNLPIVLYNFPGVCNGVDLDADTIADIAKDNPTVVGVKLTCGNTSKIVRLADIFTPSEFSTFGGQSDFLIAGLATGSAGCIAAFANVFPKSISRIFKLYKEGKVDEAMKIHRIAAHAESPCKLGIAATKYAAAIHSAKAAGIEGAEEKLWPRKPYLPCTEAVKATVQKKMAALDEIERTL